MGWFSYYYQTNWASSESNVIKCMFDILDNSKWTHSIWFDQWKLLMDWKFARIRFWIRIQFRLGIISSYHSKIKSKSAQFSDFFSLSQSLSCFHKSLKKMSMLLSPLNWDNPKNWTKNDLGILLSLKFVKDRYGVQLKI